MRLPTDPAKLKLCSREYIMKHCRALEGRLDALESRLLQWRKEKKGTIDLSNHMLDEAITEFYETPLDKKSRNRLDQLLSRYEIWTLISDIEKETLFNIKCLLEHLERE